MSDNSSKMPTPPVPPVRLHVKGVVIALLSILSASCPPGGRAGLEGVGKVLLVAQEAARRQFHVAVINIERRHDIDAWESYLGRPWSDADEASRLFNVSVLLRQLYSQWSGLALQELYYERDYVYSFPATWYVELEDLDIDGCGSVARNSYLAADCLGARLHTELTFQNHANGIVADDDLWETIPWPKRDDLQWLCDGFFAPYDFCHPRSRISNHIGEMRTSIIYRNVIGVRLRNRLSGIVVPFFSTHLSNTNNVQRHTEELEDLVQIVKSNYVSGDMPPIIAGDFNCENWDQGLRDIIYTDFVEASGTNAVMGVFVGRPQSFPRAPGIWHLDWWPGPTVADLRGPIDAMKGKLLAMNGNEELWELTDHGMVTVTLTANLDLSPNEVSWPHLRSDARLCWPF